MIDDDVRMIIRDLMIGLGAIVVFELSRLLFDWIRAWYRARDALVKLLAPNGGLSIARSVVAKAGKSFVRDSDFEVENMLPIRHRTDIEHESFPSFDDPSRSVIVIGSTRYNRAAHAVQRHFALPYQFVWLSVDDDPSIRELGVITEDGEEFKSLDPSVELGHRERVDYGILLVARLRNDKRVFWIGGIHGAGTIGVARYLTKNATAIRRALPSGENVGACWLLRVTFRQGETGSLTETPVPELLGAVRQTAIASVPPARALVCDFGNVVMEFDRSRTYRAIAHRLRRDFRHVQSAIETSDIRQRYESGELDTTHFVVRLYEVLGCGESDLPRELVEEFWGDIFWERPQMRVALKTLRSQGIPLVLLSNTNPLHFEHVRRDYPDLINLFDEIILSYQEHKSKPNPALFEKAIDAVRKRGVSHAEHILYVDDDQINVRAANDLGMRAYTYRSFSQFAFWLRRNGLYIE